MARTHAYRLDMMQVRLDWMTERLEAQEKAFEALLGAASRELGRRDPGRREPGTGRPQLAVLKGGRA
jgi:hypothetical protein